MTVIPGQKKNWACFRWNIILSADSTEMRTKTNKSGVLCPVVSCLIFFLKNAELNLVHNLRTAAPICGLGRGFFIVFFISSGLAAVV